MSRFPAVLSRIFIRTSLLFVMGFGASVANAAGQPYEQSAFDALQRDGKPALVMVHASWCPTCKAQEPLITELLKEPANKEITALRVDFDKQKSVVRHFKVTMQSTLIVFRNGKEVGRSTGDTSKAGIAALLAKAAPSST